MDDRELMRAGEFGAATRLSPKALRLYAEQGLLVPAQTDPGTGYRSYHRDQIPRARLIARLRRLDLPLARISTLIDLPAEARQAELGAWLAAQEEELRRRRELVELLDSGGPMRLEPRIRPVPSQKLVYREKRLYVDALADFIQASKAILGDLGSGPLRVHYHGLVTRDSDGPVEVSLPFTGPLEPSGDLRIRLSPGYLEGYVPVTEPDASFPAVLRIYDALETWIDANQLVCVASPYEIFPGTDGVPFDIAYPIERLR